ncbi:hypothetical protein GSI_03231 [Ganoderma sinense ZZ0214-1]|uniref:SURP motif domain-containing protein n=1 Tax=Ganoderma sinense ZZ0214-1 TaxID=1077348 RepID=A0A2G8SL10_9APHY|nr:hypothetical protein GSI_03231 [Ganoderma sinense ZZ0214-1]
MLSVSKKRKHRPYDTQEHDQHSVQPDTLLFIQAHEADLVHGPQAAAAARSLEVRKAGSGEEKDYVGDGLIRWGAHVDSGVDGKFSDEGMTLSRLGRDSESPRGNESQVGGSGGRGGVWVDRYDARLLLESLPNFSSPTENGHDTRLNSPGGWSDLPSDAEDTFFFSAEEVEDYRREKRRRVMDSDREARLRAIRAEEGDSGERDPREDWGGSDEEPDDPQRELMRRTASHILASPNPAQLEMRILANHGADARFAFLRGRWSRAWRLAKGKARLEMEAEKRRKEEDSKAQNNAGIGGLAGYGDSDAESEDGEDDPKPAIEEASGEAEGQVGVSSTVEPAPEPDEEVKAARRARAREWAEKRRAAKEAVDGRVEDS